MTVKVCQFCGQGFNSFSTKGRPKKYCSDKCRSRAYERKAYPVGRIKYTGRKGS